MAASALVAALFFFFVAQPALSRPEQSALPDMQQMIKEFQTSIDKSVAEAKKQLNLPENPDGAAIVKMFREQANNAEKTWKEWQTKVESLAKDNPQIAQASKDLKAKYDEAMGKLKKENPELHANAQKMMDTMKSTQESAVKEMERINAEINKKGGLRDDMDNLFKGVLDKLIAGYKDTYAKLTADKKKA